VLSERDLGASEGRVEEAAIESFVAGIGDFDAAGVRVVHGGSAFRDSVIVDAAVLAELHNLDDLAPLHNPPAVRAIEVLRRLHPERVVIACFDTAFHSTIPEAAAVYAVPWEWTETWGVRRFGFHGLSHQSAARRAAAMLGRPIAELRTVTCHLGAGASLAAVAGGRSVDTTMGFTPMEGLVMATRSGSVDPGLMLHALRRHGMTPEQLERALDRSSGILGVSGISADMREVEAAALRGDPRARLAVDVYVHRLCGAVAQMAATMGGLDVLVFTGGVGEGSALIRAQACGALAFLGLALDETRNRAPGDGDVELSSAGAAVSVLRIRAREDLAIAGEVRRCARL
jgi:acetate kinase